MTTKKGGFNFGITAFDFGITEFDFGITEFNFGITETKSITFISLLAFDPLTKLTMLVFCAWLLHPSTTTPYSYNGCSTL